MLKKLVLVVFMLLFAASLAVSAETVDRIVAIVNGEIITLYDLNRELAPMLTQYKGRELRPEEEAQIRMLRQRLVERRIDDILLLQEAERLEFKISDADVENHIKQIKKQNGMTDEQFLEQLRLENLSLDEYKKRVKEQMLRSRILSLMVNRKVLVTDEDVERYFNEHKSEYSAERKVGLGLILFAKDAEVDNIASSIRKGEISFSKAADTYSQGPGAGQGGDIGELKWADLAPDWKAAIEGLSPGGISKPFVIGDRKAMLELRSSTSADDNALDSVREEIRDLLLKPRYETVYKEYIQKLRDKAIVEIKL